MPCAGKTFRGRRYIRLSLEERFWSGVDKSAGCWIWKNALKDGAYPSLKNGDTQIRASKVSYELHIGKVDAGLCVLHKCDNRRCVNPWHLFLGTRADNSADMVAKDRERRGEAHPNHKLTIDDVRNIRALIISGSSSQGQLARKYGVNQSCISRIANKKRWVKEA